MAVIQVVGRERADRKQNLGGQGLTRHARDRMTARRIPMPAVQAAMTYGRVVYVRGAEIRAIGRKEVERYRHIGIDLGAYEGVQVVCAHDGAVLTAYRNHDFRGMRAR